jgi:hypothetical protein
MYNTIMNRLLAVNIGDLPTGTGKTISATFPTLSSLVTVILKNSFTIIGLILLFLLIFGGFMFIMNAGNGDQKKAAQGQAIITDAVIGFVVVFLAYAIVQIIQVITGVNILNSTL